MKCLILAGGFGTRLYRVGIHRAKGLVEYKDQLLMTCIVNKVPRDISILVTTNERFEADFQKWRQTIDREVEICVESALGNGHKLGAVSALDFWIDRKAIAEDLLVIAGDNYFEFDLAGFIAAYNGKNPLIGVHDIGDKSKASQFGVVKLNGNRLVELEEKPSKPRSSLIATAIYILPARIFPLLREYCAGDKRDNLGSFIAYLLQRDDVYAYPFTEFWLDVGSGLQQPAQ